MIAPKTIADLRQLIQSGLEENQQLEYKAPGALQKSEKKEISKDISGMANAAGGIIIYGIGEDSNNRHLPGRIIPIHRDDFSKETLENIIDSCISPRIEGLLIHPIQSDLDNQVIYVVEIPQSTTAHQNTMDNRYYKRRNFKVEPMQDYEIRDVMNRLAYPKIEIQFELQKQLKIISASPSFGHLQGHGLSQRANDLVIPTLILKFWPANKGSRFANYINYFIDLPATIIADEDPTPTIKISDTYVRIYGDNIVSDANGPSRYEPLLPGLRGRSKKVILDPNIAKDQSEIVWEVYADNAPSRKGTIKFEDIVPVEKAPL